MLQTYSRVESAWEPRKMQLKNEFANHDFSVVLTGDIRCGLKL